MSQSYPPDLIQGLHFAQACLQGGRPAEAEATYRQLLAQYPGQPDLLGRLGGLLLQTGRPEAALPWLEQAKQVAPGNGQTWLALAQCLLALNRSKEAKKLLAEAMRLGLKHPQVDELLKQARTGHKQKTAGPMPLAESLRRLDQLLQAGRAAEAEDAARELVQRHPKVHQAWYCLGMARLLQGRAADSLEPFRRAIGCKPDLAQAHYNLGFALEKLERLEEARAAYQAARDAAPDMLPAYNNLGTILLKLGRPQEAVAAYEAMLARKPDWLEAWLNLGAAWVSMGSAEQALAAFRRAAELQADSFEAHRGMGHALRGLQRYAEAAEAYRQAAAIRPNDADIHLAVGMALHRAQQYGAARKAFETALQLRPDSEDASNALAGLLADMGDLDGALERYRRDLAAAPQGRFKIHSNFLLSLNYHEAMAPEALFAEARAYGEKAARLATPEVGHANLVDPARRLRVGLVSGDLGEHPVGYFLVNVLENIDPGQIELFAYATTERNDPLNARLRRCIPHWREAMTSKLDDAAFTRQVQADGIDILIDLAGHTGGNRLPAFAWKPAPVQVTWLGYFATTGLTAMDWVLADRWVLPEAEEGQFVEKPWRLPDAYYCFTPPDLELAVAPLPAARNGFVTFGCFNNPRKLNNRVIACWARVLQAVPESRLFLKYKGYEDADFAGRIAAQFEQYGIGQARLRFEGPSPRAEYLATYNEVDIALDPFPFPGGTTSVEGLWMGVPVLTLKGERFIGHQGETILHNAGLPDWIAGNVDEYVAKAAAFAADLPALARLRAGLRPQLLASPLCDAPRFARNLEAALRGMWRIWCERQAVR